MASRARQRWVPRSIGLRPTWQPLAPCKRRSRRTGSARRGSPRCAGVPRRRPSCCSGRALTPRPPPCGRLPPACLQPSPFSSYVKGLPDLTPPRTQYTSSFSALDPITSPSPAEFNFARPQHRCAPRRAWGGGHGALTEWPRPGPGQYQGQPDCLFAVASGPTWPRDQGRGEETGQGWLRSSPTGRSTSLGLLLSPSLFPLSPRAAKPRAAPATRWASQTPVSVSCPPAARVGGKGAQGLWSSPAARLPACHDARCSL